MMNGCRCLRCCVLLLGIGCALLRFPLVAEGRDSSRWSAGTAIVSAVSPYCGMKRQTMVVPFLSYDGPLFSLQGPRLSAAVRKNSAQTLAAVAEFRFQSLDPDKSAVLAGMQRRRFSVDAGLEYTHRLRYGLISLLGLMDTLNRHRGWELRLTAMTYIPLRAFFLSPYAGLSWHSRQLADYYYGVRAGEAQASRSEYAADAGLQPFIGIRLGWRGSSRFAIIGGLTRTYLPATVRSSPIVCRDAVLSGQLAAVYRL